MSLEDIWFAALGKVTIAFGLMFLFWRWLSKPNQTKIDFQKEKTMNDQTPQSEDGTKKTALQTAKQAALAGAIYGVINTLFFAHFPPPDTMANRIAMSVLALPVWGAIAGVIGFIWGKIRGRN